MSTKYFNFEIRRNLISELDDIKGIIGLRVYIEENNSFYFWNTETQTWASEKAGIELGYSNYVCQLFSASGYVYDNVLGEHTLPNFINWERLETGLYRGTLLGGFPNNRTQFIYSGVVINESFNVSPPDATTYSLVSVKRIDNDTIFVRQIDETTKTPVDGLFEFPLEIRVYPNNNYRD